MQSADTMWMKRALALAERGRGHVEPNPLVGALLVRDGVLVGEGWHEKYGQAHAEVNALNMAGDMACGATLYVTLEPCCHHGKTPPCTDAVLRAGIARVVAAMPDPFPQVAGRGAALLRAAGVAVEVGLEEAAARRLNAPYLQLLATGRPYVHAKWAMTLDGKIATRSGDSRWISNEQSRQRMHALRGRMDGILVGSGTVLADDPLLTARPPGPRTAARIVLDRRCRTPRNCQLVRTAKAAPTLLVTGKDVPEQQRQALESAGCEVLPLLGGNHTADILTVLAELGRRRMTNLLVEGGSEILGSFVAADAVDEFHVCIAPCIVGGSSAPGPVAGVGVERMRDVLRLVEWEVLQPGGDVLLHGWRRRPVAEGI